MYCSRHLEGALFSEISRDKVKLILGPRQSGKTTLLRHTLSTRANLLVVNLQDRRQRIKYERERSAFLQELEALPAGTTVFVDEIQKVPELFEDVQYAVDEHPGRFDFFLTGSSARKLKRGSANLLPGRTHLFALSPVLQAEQRETEILSIEMSEKRRFPMRSLEELLIYGNLPGLYHESKESWLATLFAYTELYIENEIRKENVVGDMGAFLSFLRLAALESGQTVNYSRLASVIGTSVNTVRNYYQILEDTYLGFRLTAFGRSRKKLVSAPRFLLFDTGVRNALCQLPMSQALVTMDGGHLFEQLVLTELYYRCRYHGRGHGISTWRTRTGAEVDAILETPEEHIPIEVKWTDAPNAKSIRHVDTFLDLHADTASRGYVICRVDRPRRITERITALPWDRF